MPERAELLRVMLQLRGHAILLPFSKYAVKQRALVPRAWWNLAVEAHPIDRAHRIGQTRPVLGPRTRIIEERVVLLQRQKRKLSEALALGALAACGSHGA